MCASHVRNPVRGLVHIYGLGGWDMWVGMMFHSILVKVKIVLWFTYSTLHRMIRYVWDGRPILYGRHTHTHPPYSHVPFPHAIDMRQ